MTVWDRIMGTYFADQEQIAKLRLRNRVEALDPRSVNTATVDLTSPSRHEEAIWEKKGE